MNSTIEQVRERLKSFPLDELMPYSDGDLGYLSTVVSVLSFTFCVHCTQHYPCEA